MRVASNAEVNSVASLKRGGVKKFGPTQAAMNIPANDGIATIRLGTKAYRIVAPSADVRDVIINTSSVDSLVNVSGRLNTKDARDPFIIVDKLEKGPRLTTQARYIEKRSDGRFTAKVVGSDQPPVILKPTKGALARLERAARGFEYGMLNLTGKLNKKANTMDVWFVASL